MGSRRPYVVCINSNAGCFDCLKRPSYLGQHGLTHPYFHPLLSSARYPPDRVIKFPAGVRLLLHPPTSGPYLRCIASILIQLAYNTVGRIPQIVWIPWSEGDVALDLATEGLWLRPEFGQFNILIGFKQRSS